MRNFFGGWYFKCQNASQTLALIPAYHKADGKTSFSIQIINNEGAWNIPYSALDCSRSADGFTMRIGGSRFGKTSVRLSAHTHDFFAEGFLKFGALTPLDYDIMGPFRFVPFLECRHDVQSIYHTVTGVVNINGVIYRFEEDDGYIEGDRGRSFPSEYLWTHCFFEGNSLMLSIAKIPIGPIRFTGLLGVIWYEGKEFRLATYLGARVIGIGNGTAVVKQGDEELTVRLIEKHAQPLHAPANGAMVRTIRESAACVATYTFRKAGKTVFSFSSDKASFEYEYLK